MGGTNVLPWPGGSPSSTQSSGGGGASNTAELLDHILNANQANLGELAKKASTPIPGGHAGQMPLSLEPTQRQFQGAPQNKTPVVGAGNARAQGIGNSVIGVLNAIGATETAITNKKKIEVASATQQLLTAQQAYDQASTLLKSDPNNADAKAAMERNKNVMNGILSNDKLRKSIAKGFNIDFTDPQSNNTPDHQGVAQGKEQAKAHIDYASQFNEKTPQVMQPNVQAQAQLAAAQANQKLNVESMRALVPLLTAQAREEGAMTREGIRQAHEDARSYTRTQALYDTTQERLKAAAQKTKDEHLNRMAEIGYKGQLSLQEFRERLSMKAADPLSQLKAYEDFSMKSTKTVSEMTKTVTDLEQQRGAAAAKKPYDAAMVSNIDQQINIAKEQLQSYQGAVKGTQDYYNKFAGVEGVKDGTDSTKRPDAGTLSSADTYLVQPADEDIEDKSDDDY
jgi:hypothetical protein